MLKTRFTLVKSVKPNPTNFLTTKLIWILKRIRKNYLNSNYLNYHLKNFKKNIILQTFQL